MRGGAADAHLDEDICCQARQREVGLGFVIGIDTYGTPEQLHGLQPTLQLILS